jgi:prepilin-type N-terminal cleavage/methylation domain-containing protein
MMTEINKNAMNVIARSPFRTTKQSQSSEYRKWSVMFSARRKAFTLVEILTVVLIIAILTSILVPALNMVRKMARDVQEKAQIAAIEVGLNLYRNEDTFGDYPPSHGVSGTNPDYTYGGAQTLVEAMFGQDFLGVDPNTEYVAKNNTSDFSDLYDNTAGNKAYDPNGRKGPYLDRTHFTTLKPGDVFKSGPAAVHNVQTARYLICDVYTQYSKMIPPFLKKVKIGTPILYFKANISETSNDSAEKGTDVSVWQNGIYNYGDNENIIRSGKVADSNKKHEDFVDSSSGNASGFYNYIKDPIASETTKDNRPVRPDSFILISAGNDGLYGTHDDICNFEPNIE